MSLWTRSINNLLLLLSHKYTELSYGHTMIAIRFNALLALMSRHIRELRRLCLCEAAHSVESKASTVRLTESTDSVLLTHHTPVQSLHAPTAPQSQ